MDVASFDVLNNGDIFLHIAGDHINPPLYFVRNVSHDQVGIIVGKVVEKNRDVSCIDVFDVTILVGCSTENACLTEKNISMISNALLTYHFYDKNLTSQVIVVSCTNVGEDEILSTNVACLLGVKLPRFLGAQIKRLLVVV